MAALNLKDSRDRKRQVLLNLLKKAYLGMPKHTPESHLNDMMTDLKRIEALSVKAFSEMLNASNKTRFNSTVVQGVVEAFIKEAIRRKAEYDKRRVDITVSIQRCPRCGKKHKGYKVKLDSDNTPFVICGNTGLPVIVSFQDKSHKSVGDLSSLGHLLYTAKCDVNEADEADLEKVCTILKCAVPIVKPLAVKTLLKNSGEDHAVKKGHTHTLQR